MALGNKNYEANQRLYVLRLKTKNADGQKVPPFFQILEKEGDTWVPQDKTVTSVTGTLSKLELKTRKFNDEEIKSVNVYLQDGDEVYLIDFRYSILGRGILNSIINIEDPSLPVEISVYENKRGYEAGAVRSGDDLVSWKFSLDEQPKAEEIKDKKGNVVKRDYSEVDEFFDNEVSEFAGRLANPTKAASKKDKPAVKKAVEAKQPAVEAQDDEDEPLFD